MARHNKLGRKGETIAQEYLLAKGYKILETNWRFNNIEIDIIAVCDEFLIFVEVKTRSSVLWGNPEDAVVESKIKRIVEAADHYISMSDIDLPARFDVIAVVKNEQGFEIEYFDDAFFPPLG